MIEINERIDVPSTPSTVWQILSDPHAVVDCVPGAALGEAQEDGSFDAKLVVKFVTVGTKTLRARYAKLQRA